MHPSRHWFVALALVIMGLYTAPAALFANEDEGGLEGVQPQEDAIRLASADFDPSFCDDEGSYMPEKCAEHARKLFPDEGQRQQAGGVAAEFDPSFCDDEGSYMPEKCAEHAQNRVAQQAPQEQPFDSAKCEFDGYETEKCRAVWEERSRVADADRTEREAAPPSQSDRQSELTAEQREAAEAKRIAAGGTPGIVADGDAAASGPAADTAARTEPRPRAGTQFAAPGEGASNSRQLGARPNGVRGRRGDITPTAGTADTDTSGSSSTRQGRATASAAAGEDGVPPVQKPGVLSDTLEQPNGERFTIERNRVLGTHYQGPSDMTAEERTRAEARVSQLRDQEQAASDRRLLGGNAPTIRVQSQGFFSDTLEAPQDGKERTYTIEQNRMGIFYKGPPDMTAEQRAQAEADVERYRAAARQQGRAVRDAGTAVADEAAAVATTRPPRESPRPSSGSSTGAFDRSLCDDEGSYMPEKCAAHARTDFVALGEFPDAPVAADEHRVSRRADGGAVLYMNGRAFPVTKEEVEAGRLAAYGVPAGAAAPTVQRPAPEQRPVAASGREDRRGNGSSTRLDASALHAGTPGEAAPVQQAAAAFDPTLCDDFGSYEPAKCEAYSRERYPSTYAAEGARQPATVAAEFDSKLCDEHGIYEPEKCRVHNARINEQAARAQKIRAADEARRARARAAAEQKRTQEAAAQQQARRVQNYNRDVADCNNIREQGKQENAALEFMLRRYEKLYQECMARVRSRYGDSGPSRTDPQMSDLQVP